MMKAGTETCRTRGLSRHRPCQLRNEPVWIGVQPQHGYALSTYVKLDLYLLEVARHALQAPVRGGLCRRAIDWPLSSAQDSCGLRSPPAWLDPTPLHDLLGQRDERGHERFRRFIGC